MMINKAQERQRLKLKISRLSKAYRHQAETEINEQLVRYLKTKKPQRIAIYLSKDNEVSTDFIYDWLLNHHWEVYAPKINGKAMSFYRIIENKKNLIWEPKFNLWEPSGTEIKATKFKVILVPVVGYNKQGYRLGHGNGYYDRWLKKYPHQTTIGLAYRDQMVNPNLNFADYDVPLHQIITNKEETNDKRKFEI